VNYYLIIIFFVSTIFILPIFNSVYGYGVSQIGSLNEFNGYGFIPIKSNILPQYDGSTPQSISKVNDKLDSEYVRKPLDGKITLFKPKKYFAGLDSSYFGWDGLAKGGIKIIDMPLYPKGILAVPFVKILAERLTKEIELTLSAKKQVHKPIVKQFSREAITAMEIV